MEILSFPARGSLLSLWPLDINFEAQRGPPRSHHRTPESRAPRVTVRLARSRADHPQDVIQRIAVAVEIEH